MKIKKLMLPHSTAILTAYLDEQPAKPKKAILIFPGGGYTTCSEREKEPIALAYFAQGFQAFTLQYRTSSPLNWEETWSDANGAMKLLQQDEWHIDRKHIFVIGFSAGGHLAGALATSGTIRPHAVILCYPLIIQSLVKLLSPQLPAIDDMVDHQTPPIFICSTFEDHVVPVRNTIRLMQALNEHQIPFECHIFTWGHHGLSLAKQITANCNSERIDDRYAQWFDLSISWLHAVASKATISKWQKGTIGALLQSDCTKIIQEFPILKDKEIREALSHYTVMELKSKQTLLEP